MSQQSNQGCYNMYATFSVVIKYNTVYVIRPTLSQLLVSLWYILRLKDCININFYEAYNVLDKVLRDDYSKS